MKEGFVKVTIPSVLEPYVKKEEKEEEKKKPVEKVVERPAVAVVKKLIEAFFPKPPEVFPTGKAALTAYIARYVVPPTIAIGVIGLAGYSIYRIIKGLLFPPPAPTFGEAFRRSLPFWGAGGVFALMSHHEKASGPRLALGLTSVACFLLGSIQFANVAQAAQKKTTEVISPPKPPPGKPPVGPPQPKVPIWKWILAIGIGFLLWEGRKVFLMGYCLSRALWVKRQTYKQAVKAGFSKEGAKITAEDAAEKAFRRCMEKHGLWYK